MVRTTKTKGCGKGKQCFPFLIDNQPLKCLFSLQLLVEPIFLKMSLPFVAVLIDDRLKNGL